MKENSRTKNKLNLQIYLSEVESEVRKLPRTEKPEKWSGANYVGGGQSRLIYLEIKTPLLRQKFKNHVFSFSHMPHADQFKIWEYVWKTSKEFEVMLFSLYWVSKNSEFVYSKKLTALWKWVDQVDNWAHSDSLSEHYSEIVEKFPDQFEILKKWNNDRNPWKRRQSLVALNFYSRFREKPLPFKKQIKLIEQLLNDEHYYVQKGVGWSLRELYNLYPKETFQFICKYADKISSPAYTATTEKLTPSEKSKFKKLRSLK